MHKLQSAKEIEPRSEEEQEEGQTESHADNKVGEQDEPPFEPDPTVVLRRDKEKVSRFDICLVVDL